MRKNNPLSVYELSRISLHPDKLNQTYFKRLYIQLTERVIHLNLSYD